MIEYIPLTEDREQDFSLVYNDEVYDFELRFNDFSKYWYINVLKDEVAIVSGLKLVVNNNVFDYLDYLGLGGLVLLDTEPDSATDFDAETDLGGRLKLYRNV